MIVENMSPIFKYLSSSFSHNDHFLSFYISSARNSSDIYKAILGAGDDEKRRIANSINSRYKIYLCIWIKFINNYEHWPVKRSEFSNNILEFFIFLLKCPYIRQ